MAYIDTSKVTIPKGFFEDLNVPKLLDWLNSQPTADVEEVVRCKDCKFFTKERIVDSIEFLCTHSLAMSGIASDKYCSYGERRDT